MPTVGTTPTTLDAGTAGELYVVNSGSVQAVIVRGTDRTVLWPGCSMRIVVNGTAVTASTVSDTTTLDVTTNSRDVGLSGSGRVAYDDLGSDVISGLGGTFGQLWATPAASTTLTGTLAAWTVTAVDCTAGAGARSLPAASSVAAGAAFVAKKADTTANALVVSRAGSDLIFGTGSGATSKSLTLAGEAVEFVSNGVDRWTIRASDTPSGALSATYARIDGTTSALWRPVTRRNCQPAANGQSNGTDTSGMYRIAHIITGKSGRLRLVYANHYGAAASPLADGTSTITVKATIEAPVAAYTGSMPATTYPVTWNNGSTTVSIAPGAVAVSDPLPCAASVNDIVYSNTYVSVTSGQRWPVGQNSLPNGLGLNTIPNPFEGGASGAPTTDTTAGGSTPPTGYVGAFFPAAVLGETYARPAVMGIGDSIMLGAHDFYNYWSGWLDRACITAGVGYLPSGHSGEQASQLQGVAFRHRMLLAPYADAVAIAYGRNDLANIGSISLATFQGYMINLYLQAWRAGKRVYGVTITPLTTSTDGFLTVGNQTAANANSYDTNKVAFNNWLRDGAPMDASYAPLATGTTSGSAIRKGAATHPLAGYLDVADAVESARDSGKWKAVERVVTDGTISSGNRNLTSATANFTSADVGKAIYITGAGAAGVAVYARISTVTSATAATYEGTGTASQTASGQTFGIGVMTDDGTHPTTSGNIAIAATVNAASL